MARFVNYGTIDSSIWISNGAPGLDAFSNYGTLKGGLHNETSTTILNNFSSMGWWMNNGNISVSGNGKVLIANYTLMLNENAAEFNKFSGSGDKNSHLVVSGNGVSFKDSNSKIILDFGNAFEFGAKYLINKITTDTSGATYSSLGVDFSHLVPKNDIYTLTQSGQYFIAKLTPQYGIIGTIHKANIRTMNNFTTISNSMIYPRKTYHSQNLGRTHSLLQHSPSLAEGARGWVEYPSLQDSALDSANHLKSYESFSYRNEAQNRRIQRQNKRNYSRESLKSQKLGSSSLRASEYERGNPNNSLRDFANQTNPSLRADSQNLRGNPKDLQAKRSNHPQN